MSAPATPAHRIHTTGRTASRMSTADIAALKHTLAAYAPPADLFKNGNIEVELGIGNGGALHARAKARPEWHFLGAEVYLNGLESLAKALKKSPQPNLFLLNEDARTLLQNLPPQSVDRLLILFPDPWPKSRHHKRRLMQTELLNDAARILKPGAELWVVTDWPSYAFHAMATIYPHPAFTLAQTDRQAADCKPAARLNDEPGDEAALGPHLLAQPPAWWQPTKYQQKAHKAGRAPWFICAFRN